MTYVAFVAAAGGGLSTVTTTITGGGGALEFNSTQSMSQFNPALGTLVDATLRLTLTTSSVITATLSGGGSPPYSITGMFSCQLRAASALSALNAILSPLLPQINISNTTPSFSIDAGNSPHVFSAMPSNDFVDISLNSILANLTGTGTFLMNCRSISGLSLSGGGGFVGLSGSNTGGFVATITYTYS